MKPNYYSVITADVVGSRKVASFTARRDQKLRELARLHLMQRWILSPYAVTAWDEFEVVLVKPGITSRVILDLRRIFYPIRLRIGIGIGPATGVHRKPVNIHAGGEAFERARHATELLRSKKNKYQRLTAFDSENEIFNSIANTVYGLHDSLLQRITAKQWAAINTQMESVGQDTAARRLKLDISTISRNLKRGYYWQLVETAGAMQQIIEAYF